MRRSSDHLTDRGIRSFKALEGKRVEVMDGAVPGLGVRVFPTGRKSWFLRYGPVEERKRIVFRPVSGRLPGGCTGQGARADRGRQDPGPGPDGRAEGRAYRPQESRGGNV